MRYTAGMNIDDTYDLQYGHYDWQQNTQEIPRPRRTIPDANVPLIVKPYA